MMQLTRVSLYTIGYAGHTLDTFVTTLRQHQIAAVLDIRMTPISRKKGFSKTQLRLALEDANIGYYHLRTLGSPSSLRKKLYADKDYSAFFQSFRDYLLMQESSLREAARLATEQRVCLMCVEEYPQICHRSVVAEAIAQSIDTPITIKNIPRL